jgi:Fur family ferric uptake transcriptional regulator
MNSAYEEFQRFCYNAGLKHSKVREKVAQLFLSSQRHLSVLEAFEKLKSRGEKVGYSTVYRTLNLLVKAGLAETVSYHGETYYENKSATGHHDHLVCQNCGRTIEFCSPDIEQLQARIAQRHNFRVTNHSLILYGQCSACQKRKEKP